MRLAIVVAVLAMFVASAMAATQCDQNTNYSSPVVDLTDSKIGSGTELKFYVFAKTNQSVGLQLEFNANGGSQCSFIHAAGDSGTATTQGYWVKSSSTGGTYPCDTYVFTATVPNAIRNCGWGDGSVTGTISTWENKLKITTQVVTGEAVYGDAITRTDVQVLKYSISYLTAVNATSTATVLPSALAFSAVTTQTFDSTSRVATLSFATSVQGPYQVNVATVNGNANWTAAIGTATTNCATPASGTGPTYQACSQTTVFTLTTTSSDVCKLSGTITGTISFSCQSSFTGACDSPNPPSAPFTFTIASDDFCPRLVEVGDLSANMYLSATPADRYNQPPTVAADYTASSVVYGSVIFSNEATLSIDKVYPQTITIISNCAGTGCPQNLVIYDLANTANDGAQDTLRTNIGWKGILSAGDPVNGVASPVADSSRLNQYIFEFILNEYSVRFDNGEQSGNVNVQVTITFKLEYDSATGQKMTEFRTLALTPAGVSASASAGIGQAGVATSSESTVLGVTQGTVVVVGCTFAALLVAVVAASVVVSRRRAATKAASKAQLSSSQVNLTLRQSPSAAATSAGLVNLSTQNLQTVQSAYDASIQA